LLNETPPQHFFVAEPRIQIDLAADEESIDMKSEASGHISIEHAGVSDAPVILELQKL
jgi:hypothetical protein